MRIGSRVAAPVERLAQAADVDVDGADLDVDVLAPDPVEQLLAARDPARALHQRVEQAELGRAEVDVALAALHPETLAVED